MKKLHSLALEQKEVAKHGEAFFPVQKYDTILPTASDVVLTHWHEEAEFTLITQGQAEYQIDLAAYPVEPGDLLFIPPLVLHAIAPGGGETGDLTGEPDVTLSPALTSESYVFHMNFLGGNSTDICSTRYLMPLANQEFSMPYLFKPSHPAYTALRGIFEQIHSLYETAEKGYELALKALFLQTVFLMLQYSERTDGTANDNLSDKLRQVLDYIELHYAENLSVATLAGLVYFSEYHFMRFFKKHMNMTCVEYINNLRLEKAVEMFEQGNTAILDVSLSAGFHNLSYFHKLFKRKYHMTPKAFINQLN